MHKILISFSLLRNRIRQRICDQIEASYARKDISFPINYAPRTLSQLDEIEQHGDDADSCVLFRFHRWLLWRWTQPTRNLLFQNAHRKKMFEILFLLQRGHEPGKRNVMNWRHSFRMKVCQENEMCFHSLQWRYRDVHADMCRHI